MSRSDREDTALDTALELAHDALRHGDDEVGLQHLLEAWREHRAPRLAALIDLVSERITTRRGAIKGKRVSDRQARWLEIERAHDPADLERLLQTPFPRSWHDGLDWLRRLKRWPRDPRLARGLAAQFAAKPYTSGASQQYWSELLKRIVKQRDWRALAWIRAGNPDEFKYPGIFRRLFDAAVEELEASLEGGAPELPAVLLPACEAVERLLGPDHADDRVEADFLAEIFAAPERDEPRLVFADWLGERGDDRGEFIVLQCRRAAAGKRPSRRESALLKASLARWCGPLEHVLRREGRAFERGFLSSCICTWEQPESVEALIGEPHWSTVRELTLPPEVWQRDHGRAPPRLLLHPVMRSLRLLHNVYADQAVALAQREQPPPLEELGVCSHIDGEHWAALARGFPALRRVVMTNAYTSLEPLWSSPLSGRLEALTMTARDAYHLSDWLGAAHEQAGPALRQLCLLGEDTRWPSRPEGWRLTFTRDHRGRFGALEAEFGAHQHYGFSIIGDHLASTLAHLPAEGLLSAITIKKSRAFKPSATQRAALAAACARFTGLTRLELPFEPVAEP